VFKRVKKLIWIIAGLALVGFLIYRQDDRLSTQRITEYEEARQNVELQGRQDVEPSDDGVVGAHDQGDVNQGHVHSDLRQQIETFIHLYYDWNYAGLTGLHLHDFVSEQFFEHIAHDIGHHAHVHDHEQKDDYFVMMEATAYVTDLEIYTLLDEDIFNNIDVMVTFDVLYDITAETRGVRMNAANAFTVRDHLITNVLPNIIVERTMDAGDALREAQELLESLID